MIKKKPSHADVQYVKHGFLSLAMILASYKSMRFEAVYIHL